MGVNFDAIVAGGKSATMLGSNFRRVLVRFDLILRCIRVCDLGMYYDYAKTVMKLLLLFRHPFSFAFGKDADNQQLERVIDHCRKDQDSGEFRVGKENRRHDSAMDERFLRTAVEGRDPVFPMKAQKVRDRVDDPIDDEEEQNHCCRKEKERRERKSVKHSLGRRWQNEV